MTRAEAKAAGLKTYLGKTCPEHVKAAGERRVANGNCVECYHERRRERRRTSEVWRANAKANMHRWRARKYEATVGDVSAINRAFKAIAREAKNLGLTVDHMTPLAGCRVCGSKGLHEPSNWALLSLSDNSSKNNRCMSCWDRPRGAKIDP
jgi:hypothetical protein